VTAYPSIERTAFRGLRPPTAVAHVERWPYEDNTLVTVRPQIVPHLWFEKEAEEAANFYCSVFPDSRITSVTVLHDTPSGDCDVVSFSLSGQPFMAISAGPFFKFNESVSFMVKCETQEELDYYWQQLSAVPGAEQCGWLKDRFGLSWQIVPGVVDEMMQSGDSGNLARVTQAFLTMKKFDIAALQEAFGSQ
jgi:predicted 3-demethylubiquinone-9 3-methyltransferase (glyoxalase superfamily)